MAQGIVNVAEVVEVDAENGQRLIGSQRSPHPLLETILEHLTIAGAGQSIKTGGMIQSGAQFMQLNRILKTADNFTTTGLVPQHIVLITGGGVAESGLGRQMDNRHTAVRQ